MSERVSPRAGQPRLGRCAELDRDHPEPSSEPRVYDGNVHPTLEIGNGSVSSYTILLTLACAVGLSIGGLRAHRDGLPWRRFAATGVAGIAAGLLGARVWSALVEMGTLTGNPTLSDIVLSGGLSVIGGLLLGALAAWSATKYAKLSFTAWLDAAAPGAACGIAIGRIGCLLAGCCYGAPTLFPIALVFERFDTVARPIGVPLHATQIYESIAAAVLTVVLFRIPARTSGSRFALFLAGYGLLRSLVETLRADYRGFIGDMPATMLAALVAAGAGFAWALYLRATLTAEKRERSTSSSPSS